MFAAPAVPEGAEVEEVEPRPAVEPADAAGAEEDIGTKNKRALYGYAYGYGPGEAGTTTQAGKT